MLQPTITIGPLTTSTYTFWLGVALLMSAGWVLAGAPDNRRGRWADVCLAGLAGGLLLGRGLHVLLNLSYFRFHTEEIAQFQSGGLSWHGALVGCLLAMVLVARWRDVALRPLLDRLTIGIPLLALALWGSCRAIGCGYGREVETLADYPGWLVWEGPDIYEIYAPRFDVQLLGIGAALLVGLVVLILFWRGWLAGRRFWFVLALWSLVMLALGGLRGDYALMSAGLRADQWLDLGLFVFSVAVGLISWRRAF